MDFASGPVPGPVMAAGIAGLVVAALALALSAGGAGGAGRPTGRARRVGALLIVGGAVALVGWTTGGFASAGTAPARPASACPPPTFVLGFAALRARLGDTMGEPLECEHADPRTGDALQQTTTGLAYYRGATSTSAFTDGYRHWALTSDRLVTWEGASVDPPSADGGVPPVAAPSPAPALPQPAAAVASAVPAAPAAPASPTGDGASLYVLIGCLVAISLGGVLLVRARAKRAHLLARPTTTALGGPLPTLGADRAGAVEGPRGPPGRAGSASAIDEPTADEDRYLEHENTGWEFVSGRFGAAVIGPLCPADRTRLLYVPEGGAAGSDELVRGSHMPGGLHGRLRCPVCKRSYAFGEPLKDVAAAIREVEIIVDERWKQRVGAVGAAGASPEGAGSR